MVTEGEKRRRKRRGWLHYSRLRQKFVEQRYKELYDKHPVVCCGICGMPMRKQDATIDHIRPLSCGGTNDVSNLQLAHEKCNWDKGNQYDGNSVGR